MKKKLIILGALLLILIAAVLFRNIGQKDNGSPQGSPFTSETGTPLDSSSSSVSDGFEDLVLLQKAVSESNESLCNDIANSDMKAQCIQSVKTTVSASEAEAQQAKDAEEDKKWFQKAVSTKNLDYCKNIKDAEKRSYCLSGSQVVTE